MKTLFLLAVIAFCFSAYAATESNAGAWTAEIDGDSLQMTIFRGNNTFNGKRIMNNIMGFSEPLGAFAGLAAGDAKATAANVSFALTRPAGTITFDGRFSSGTGAGHFRFTRNPEFVRDMETLGYSGFSEDQMLIFAAHDFSPQTIRDLRAMGYQPSQREVEEIAIFGISAELLREYARLGYPNLTLRKAIEFRIGRIDAAYVNGMRDLGYTNLSAGKIANLAILGVKPAYVRELQNAGLKNLTVDELDDLRIGHVTAERIEQYRRLGYNDLSARQLGEMGIHGVTPKYIEELRTLGYTNIPARQLIEMKIFGVTPDYIRKMNSMGYSNLPVDKLVKLKMSGLIK